MMKLWETLTDEEKIQLINREIVGIFSTMILSGDDYYSLANDLCLGYYMERSGQKTISKTYQLMLDTIKDNNITNETAESLLGKLIRGKYSYKWTKIYNALMNNDYKVLDEYASTTITKGNNVDETNYASQVGKTGANKDETIYNTTNEDDGTSGSSEVTTRNTENNNDVYGFNSVSPVGANTNNEVITEKVEGEASKNTTHNTSTKTGTDTKNFTINENQSKTGKDTINKTIDENENVNGRYKTGAELITKELDMREKQILFNIFYRDIDSVVTLQIYE